MVVKFDTTGSNFWEHVYTFKGELGRCDIVTTSDGNYILGGTLHHFTEDDSEKIFLMKLSSEGEQIWLNYFNEQVSWWVGELLLTEDDEIIFQGNLTADGDSNRKILLMKTNTNGEIVWRQEYGQANRVFSANSLSAADNGFVLGGNPHFMKLDETGKLLWQRNYPQLGATACLIQTPDLGYAMIGTNSSPQNPECDMVFIKTDQQGNTTEINDTPDPVVENFALFQNYPNPFNAATTISWQLPAAAHVTLSVYNSRGQRIETLVGGWKKSGMHRVIWNARNAGTGVYFFKISAGAFASVRKCVLIK